MHGWQRHGRLPEMQQSWPLLLFVCRVCAPAHLGAPVVVTAATTTKNHHQNHHQTPPPRQHQHQVLAISQGGLERRGYDEAHFLKQLHAIVESGLCAASHELELYSTSWNKSVDPLFRDFMY